MLFAVGAAVEDTVVTNLVANLDVEMNVQDEPILEPLERLHFHSRTGSLVKLSCNGRTAERLRPLDEFNNGVVMTHRSLQDDQLFEVILKYCKNTSLYDLMRIFYLPKTSTLQKIHFG